MTKKSLIPDLEPCAILLEFAKAMRIEQPPKLKLSMDDAVTIFCASQTALKPLAMEVRMADFNAPDNPRRIRLVLEGVQPALKVASPAETE